MALLQRQDASTSKAVIETLAENSQFIELSKVETAGIIKRDEEDASKLQTGIDLAISKKVIPDNVEVEPITKIDVIGKTPGDVADIMIEKLGEAAKTGCVMTLQGFSGTGKGTTVAELIKRLPNATCWSNGNVFRSLTLLATTYAEQNNCELEAALTPEILQTLVGMLEFDKYNDKFDVKIEGLGMKEFVSEIANTKLKSSAVSSKIPTVAGVTQGEVITFVQTALKKMADAGNSVLVEGREQTLNYIRTPFRFELVLSDSQVIGRRRAAQKISALALESVDKEASEDDIQKALVASLEKLAPKL